MLCVSRQLIDGQDDNALSLFCITPRRQSATDSADGTQQAMHHHLPHCLLGFLPGCNSAPLLTWLSPPVVASIDDSYGDHSTDVMWLLHAQQPHSAGHQRYSTCEHFVSNLSCYNCKQLERSLDTERPCAITQ
jgi:hypothetical protein